MDQARHHSSLTNALATPDQLLTSSSRLDGVPADLESSILFASSRLLQAAGILLHLPQDIIAQCIVVFQRFWISPDGGSLKEYDANRACAAALYLTTKISTLPKSPRSIVNVFAYLDTLVFPFPRKGAHAESYDNKRHFVSESEYLRQRTAMLHLEAIMLRTVGFSMHVALPYTLSINYLQALDVMALNERDVATKLAGRVFAHLNTALTSPQLLYLTHQPTALATAAIYIAARETSVKLPANEWWKVFDTDREELGFLVVALNSMVKFAEREAQVWNSERPCPLTVKELEAELLRRGDAG